MKKTTLYIMACVAAAALALAACSKNEESPVATAATATADNTRTVVYSVGGDEGRTTLKDDAEWDAMLERFCSVAAEGQTVTFYSLGRPQRHSAASKADNKEDQHFSTDDREEMKAWMKAREKEGLTVSVSYDEQSGRWNGVARETTAMRQDLTECYTGTMTCVDMPWEDDMIVGATVPALVLADSTVLILVHDDYTLVCGMPLDGYGDEDTTATFCGTVEQRQTAGGETYSVLNISRANAAYMAGTWRVALAAQYTLEADGITAIGDAEGYAAASYTLSPDGTATSGTATGTWSLDADGMLCCDLLGGGEGCWEVNWLTATTLVISHYTALADGGALCHQLVLERVGEKR